MEEYGDIPGDRNDPSHDGMTFCLDPLKAFETEKGSRGGIGDDPMWSSASSGPGDWFFAEEG